MPVTSYSRTAANNNSAPPAGAPEGQTPGSVNNVLREMMKDIVNEAGKGSARVLGTVAGTNTVTAGMSPALDAYVAGMMVVLTPANANTGAVTLNIDALGALDVQNPNGSALPAGALTAGVPAVLMLDSGADDWVLINHGNNGSGSFTGTLTGMSGATTGTVSYKISNGIVSMYLSAAIIGTSNSSSMTMTGLPAVLAPTSASGRHCYCTLMNNASQQPGVAVVDSTPKIIFDPFSGVSGINVFEGIFITSGTKGLPIYWCITYPL